MVRFDEIEFENRKENMQSEKVNTQNEMIREKVFQYGCF